MTEKHYLALVSSFFTLGIKRINLLYGYFLSYEKIWKASKSDLSKVDLSERLSSGFDKYRKSISEKDFFKFLGDTDIKFVTILDDEYPDNLKKVEDHPLVLYYKGSLKKADKKGIAVVGSRLMTAYGQKITQEFVKKLAKKGITIISGLAKGVDTCAHKTALTEGVRTLAVLACGLDRVYPLENTSLAHQIVKNGALLSEYPPKTNVQPFFFAQRNRIISGLSLGVLVIEGAAKSGTLLTASQAANQGVNVYAVPGKVNEPLSAASHFLIKNGATLCDTPQQIIEDLDL